MKAIIKIPKGTVGSGSTVEDRENFPPCPEDITAIFEHENLEVSDGYHTFDELYDHRIELYIALCRHKHELLGMENPGKHLVWRSKNHSDGEPAFGGTWFVLGIGTEKGKQITYHLPMSKWEETEFAETLEKAPEWDGHTSADVIERLKLL